MSCLHYKNNELYIENVALNAVNATFGTPCYVYSETQIEKNWLAIDTAFKNTPHQICYAVKANSNIHLLKILTNLSSGFDIVSVGELQRLLAAGCDPQKIIFSGVAKTEREIETAIQKNIYCFNVESEAELARIQTIANHHGVRVNIALRVNPNVDPHTHTYISTGLGENKFGIDVERILPICKHLNDFPALKLIGLACHIGSQITKLNPFVLALDRLIDIYHGLMQLKIPIQHLNMGGGLGIHYHEEKPIPLNEYAEMFIKKLRNLPVTLFLEPGRLIVGDAGVLLTRIEYLKHASQKNFAITDAGMNDLLRPALYNAWQLILPVNERAGDAKNYDVVGPVCESADFLGKNRQLVIEAGDLLAIDSAGAYGFSMSSNYNSRPRCPEVLIHGDKMQLIRRRETIADSLALEIALKKARIFS